MSSIAHKRPVPPVRRRPGIVKGLGIANIVFSVLGMFSVLSTLWMVAATSMMKAPPRAEMKIEVVIKAPASAATAPPAGKRTVPFFNPFIGMDDVYFLRYSVAHLATEVPLVALMFATGIGLLNLKGWAGRWWFWLSWASILRAVLLGGYFIVAVTPSMSESMAKSVHAMFQQQGLAAARIPPIQDLMRIYSIMLLVGGLLIIFCYSIYPVISILLLGRPGVKAALAEKPAATEVELL